MAAIFFPTVEEIIRLHEILIERFGGSKGLRDQGLLSSAVHRPQSGYYETLFDQAASLFQSLAMNHVFIDGNKRVAFGAADTFLICNGLQIEVEGNEAERFLIEKIIKGKVELTEISKWLEKHSKPI